MALSATASVAAATRSGRESVCTKGFIGCWADNLESGGRAQPDVRARYVCPARTRTVRCLRRSNTSTAPCMTLVRVPAQVSRVTQRVPRTVATLLRPRLRKRPLRSFAHRPPDEPPLAFVTMPWTIAARAVAVAVVARGDPAG